MPRYLTALVFFAPALLLGQAPIAKKTQLPAISLLPDGSQLKGVMLPRYNQNQNIVGVLKAQTMMLVNEEQIAGTNVTLEFFNPDESPRGRVDLKNAIFYRSKGLVVAKQDVEIKSDRLTAHGSGLVYSLTNGEGFLSGPATTTIQNPTETAMQKPNNKLRATALAGLALVSQPLAAAPPPHLTTEEKAALKADAATKAPALAAANARTETVLAESAALVAKANTAAATFLADAQIPNPAADITDAAAAKPLEVKPSPTQTTITCDGGMYFDADEGILVYSKNVVVKDPRFDLSGANELKVFLSKKPPSPPEEPDIENQKENEKEPAPKPDKKAMGNIGASFGDVERILATGAVRILQKEVEGGKPPIEASGAIFNYNVKSGEIIISGGYPWVLQGANYLRATKPDLNLRIQKSGSFATEGNWQMGGELNEKK